MILRRFDPLFCSLKGYMYMELRKCFKTSGRKTRHWRRLVFIEPIQTAQSIKVQLLQFIQEESESALKYVIFPESDSIKM